MELIIPRWEKIAGRLPCWRLPVPAAISAEFLEHRQSNLNSAAPMPLMKMLALGIVLLPALPAAAQSQPQTTLVPCDAFQKNPDGSWSPLRQVVIAGPNGPVTVS